MRDVILTTKATYSKEREKNCMETNIYAVCNQKGGVEKTVTAVNLGIGLAHEGKCLLLVDVDAQGSMTASLGLSAARTD